MLWSFNLNFFISLVLIYVHSHADQKKMIEELSEHKESMQGSLVQNGTEVNHLKEEAAVFIKDKEELQSRLSACQ